MSTKLIPAATGLGLALTLTIATVGGAATADADTGDEVVALSPERPVLLQIDPDGDPTFARSVYANEARDLGIEPAPAPAPAPAPEPAPAPLPAPVPVAEAAPAPAPPPPPAPTGNSVTDIISRHFGPAASKAIAVADCESGLNPSAMSPGGGNHGLFQINSVHQGKFQAVTGAPWSAVYDAEANTIFAKWLYDQSGWGPWACA